MKTLDTLLTDLAPFNVLSTNIELSCQAENHLCGHECEERLTYDRGCEAIEINELVLEACDHHGWEADRILCTHCKARAKEADAAHDHESRLLMERDVA